MSKDVTGKSAISTCSTSGIGLGRARAFAGAGANMMLRRIGDTKEIESMSSGQTAESKVILWPEQATRDVMLALQPSKQFVMIEQVAAPALFQASNNAQSNTGGAYSSHGSWTGR